jgi:hypothetical protein
VSVLDPETRAAVLRLRQEGHGTRTIAEALGISRGAAQGVIRRGDTTRPRIERDSAYERHLDRVRDLHRRCRGNLVRVHEVLGGEGVTGSYAALTRFCRLHGIGVEPRKVVGTWDFAPGEEMQHDTSPHAVEIGGRRRRVQCASLVLCHSRVRYCQVYPAFSRFTCKAFLSEAIQFLGGAARRCMIDNSSVILAGGSGKDAIIAPEMEAFARRFSFTFEAHAPGYAERSARVERPFHEIEHNFYPGRSFDSLADLNVQFLAWCATKNQAFKRHLQASPAQLFAAERAALRPLPLHIPEVVEVLHRTVDSSGDVRIETNRYSVPDRFAGARVEVLASVTRVRVVHRHEVVADHPRAEDGAHARVRDRAHRATPHRVQRTAPLLEEKVLAAAGPEFTAMYELLKRTRKGRAVKALRRLHRVYLDYPTEVVREVLVVAIEHGLDDLDRVERMVLRRLGSQFFRLPTTSEDDADG